MLGKLFSDAGYATAAPERASSQQSAVRDAHQIGARISRNGSISEI